MKFNIKNKNMKDCEISAPKLSVLEKIKFYSLLILYLLNKVFNTAIGLQCQVLLEMFLDIIFGHA